MRGSFLKVDGRKAVLCLCALLSSAAVLHAAGTNLFDQQDLTQYLTSYLQTEYARERGEIEVRLTRSWKALQLQENDAAIRVLDFPASGLSGTMVLRVQLISGKSTYGPWQIPVQIKLWRDVVVARSTVKPGALLIEADLATERRDVLNIREPLLKATELSPAVEIAESIPTGNPVLARAVRLRPVIKRGQVIEAQLHDGGMIISLKVEALENGAPGQVMRVRNPASRREFRAKVRNENLVQVVL